MNLEPIATYLQTKSCGTVGESIFVGEMPSSCNTGILLLDAYYGTQINQELPNYYNTEFRVIVRSPVRTTGMTLATSVMNALNTRVEAQLTGMAVRRFMPLNLPRPYRRSVGGYWEFEIDIDVVFNELAV